MPHTTCLLRSYRNLQDANHRGKWASDSSLKRYSKETRLIEVMSVPQQTIDEGSQMGRKLAADLMNSIPADIAAYNVGK